MNFRGSREYRGSITIQFTLWGFPVSKKIIIHVGHGKTGSSAIQQRLTASSEQGSSEFLYPKVGQSPDGAHHELFRAEEEVFQKLYLEIKRSSQKNIIISSESGLPNMRHFSKRGDYKYKFFQSLSSIGKVKVVYYVRNHFEMIESAFLQYLKANNSELYSALNMGNTDKVAVAKDALLDLYFNESIRRSDWLTVPPTRQFDYFANVVEYWGDIYGLDSIITRVYDKKILRNGDIINDFLSILPFEIKSTYTPRLRVANPTTIYKHFPRSFLLGNEALSRIASTFESSARSYAHMFLDAPQSDVLLKGF